MATVTLTPQQGAALYEVADYFLSGQINGDSLGVLLDLEERYAALVGLARQVAHADKATQPFDLSVPDVAVAMRSVVLLLDYNRDSLDGDVGDLTRGPVCQEDRPDYLQCVESAVSRHADGVAVRQALVGVMAQLALLRVDEMEFRPLNELREIDGGAFVPRAEAEFMGVGA